MRSLAKAVVAIFTLACAFVIAPIAAFSMYGLLSGWRFHTVTTNSMEPTYPVGTMLVIEPLRAGDIEVGDPIAFVTPAGANVAHRVVKVVDRDGQPTFATRGDANDADDSGFVTPARLRGRVRVGVPMVGQWSDRLTTPEARAALPGVPLVLLLASSLLSRKKTANEEAADRTVRPWARRRNAHVL